MESDNRTNSEETKKVWKKPQLSKLEELHTEGKSVIYPSEISTTGPS